MQLSATLAALSQAFRGEGRTRAFASWGSVVGAGIATGPIIGGLITQSFGWQWAFYIHLPVGVAAIVMIALFIDESKDPDAMRLDIPGVVSFSAFLFLTTLALIYGNHRGWTDATILAFAAGAVVFCILVIAVEYRQARPMLDLSFFASPPIWVPISRSSLSPLAC